MTLADRTGLPGREWYVPAVFTLAAFAVGVQLTLAFQALGDVGYPGEGRAWLAWLSGLTLAVLVVAHIPFELLGRLDLAALRERLPRREARVARLDDGDEEDAATAEPAPVQPSRETEARRLKVRVHSPLAMGPVIAPGEPLPITIQAEPEHLAPELEVTIEIVRGEERRSQTVTMTAPTVVHSETLDEEGPFELVVTVKHPHAPAATKTIAGRVTSYREEVGRLFDELKADAENAALDVASHSTPREVAQALARGKLIEARHVRELAASLETALYDDTAVERSTYETIHAILSQVTFETPEAAP